MRIIADITKIEIKDEFVIITARDIRNRFHNLFFNEEKWNQIKYEYGGEDILGKCCILDCTENGISSSFIQTDLTNDPIFTIKI